MSDQALLSDVGLGMVLTYLLHSTGILAVCWIVVKLLRPESSWFQDKLWKSGALLGIATAFASTVATANSCSWGLPLVARGACHDLEASSGSKSISPVAPEASIEEELPIEVWEEPNAGEQNVASEPTQPIPHAELPLEEYHGHAELPETPSKELFPARGWHVESAASGPWHWGLGLPMVASVCVLFGVWRLLWNYRACSRLLATCRTDNGGAGSQAPGPLSQASGNRASGPAPSIRPDDPTNGSRARAVDDRDSRSGRSRTQPGRTPSIIGP